MQYWLLPAILCGILIPGLLICRQLRRRRIYAGQDFTRKLETLLKPRETVKVICPQKGGHCILTSSRLIFEKKGEFQAFPLKSIKRIHGCTKEGKRTTVPSKMASAVIQMEKEQILFHSGAEFEDLMVRLQKIRQKNSKKEK